MEEEFLLESSGEFPIDHVDNIIEGNVGDESSELLVPSTDWQLLPYSPNYVRIGLLALKCLLVLLVALLSALIRKDFLKSFVLVLLLPIALETAFDVFIEVKQGVSYYDIVGTQSDVVNYLENFWELHGRNISLMNLPRYALNDSASMFLHTSTYMIIKNVSYVSLVMFILWDFIFWSSLFTSLVAFYYAHKAITRAEQITYLHYTVSMVKIQVFPLLFTAIETAFVLFELPHHVYFAVTLVLRFVACLVAFCLFVQFVISIFMFCVPREDYSKASPFHQVRHSKSRLFWFLIYQVLLQALNAPHIFWAGVSFISSFISIFSLPSVDLPKDMAHDAFMWHLMLLMARPLLILVGTVLLLPPYRHKFSISFCPCCSRR